MEGYLRELPWKGKTKALSASVEAQALQEGAANYSNAIFALRRPPHALLHSILRDVDNIILKRKKRKQKGGGKGSLWTGSKIGTAISSIPSGRGRQVVWLASGIRLAIWSLVLLRSCNTLSLLNQSNAGTRSNTPYSVPWDIAKTNESPHWALWEAAFTEPHILYLGTFPLLLFPSFRSGLPRRVNDGAEQGSPCYLGSTTYASLLQPTIKMHESYRR